MKAPTFSKQSIYLTETSEPEDILYVNLVVENIWNVSFVDVAQNQ